MGKLDIDAITARRAALADELTAIEMSRAAMLSEDRDLAVAEKTLKRLEQSPQTAASGSIASQAAGGRRRTLMSFALVAAFAALVTTVWQSQRSESRLAPSTVARSETPSLKPAMVEEASAPQAPRQALLETPRRAPRRDTASRPARQTPARADASDGIEVLQAEELAAISQAAADQRTP